MTAHDENTYRNGCRCGRCRAAIARYANLRRLDALHGRPRLIDGTGTRRRLQALAANGWSMAELAHMLNVTGPSINARLRKTGPVHRDTAAKVRALYDDLWDVTPPPMTGKAAGVRARIRRQAAERGWAVPMAWDAIDDPTATPHIDDTPAHERRSHRGHGRVNADSLTDCAIEWSMTREQTADRLNVSRSSIEHCLRRMDDQEHADTLRERFHRNAVTQGLDRPTRDGLGLRSTA